MHRVTTRNNEWQQVVQRVTTNNNEWQIWQWVVQRMSASDSEWQRVTASGKTYEKGTIHIEEWMIAIFSVANSRNWWLQLEWLSKYTAPNLGIWGKPPLIIVLVYRSHNQSEYWILNNK